MRDRAKEGSLGFWEASKNITKSNMQVQEFKYRQWEDWIKEGRQITGVRNEEEEFKKVIEELSKMSKSQTKVEHNKIKIILDMLIGLFQNHFTKKYLKFL